ncbi:MAG: hypothetical protein ACI4B6_07920 [Atopobiaceae bacterium]
MADGQGRRHTFVLPKVLEERFAADVEAECGGNASRYVVQCIREHMDGGDDMVYRVRDAVREELSQSGVVRTADLQAVAQAIKASIDAQVVDVSPALPEVERSAAEEVGRARGYEDGFKASQEEHSRDLEAIRAEVARAHDEAKQAAEDARREERERIANMGIGARRRYLRGSRNA